MFLTRGCMFLMYFVLFGPFPTSDVIIILDQTTLLLSHLNIFAAFIGRCAWSVALCTPFQNGCYDCIKVCYSYYYVLCILTAIWLAKSVVDLKIVYSSEQ